MLNQATISDLYGRWHCGALVPALLLLLPALHYELTWHEYVLNSPAHPDFQSLNFLKNLKEGPFCVKKHFGLLERT